MSYRVEIEGIEVTEKHTGHLVQNKVSGCEGLVVGTSGQFVKVEFFNVDPAVHTESPKDLRWG